MSQDVGGATFKIQLRVDEVSKQQRVQRAKGPPGARTACRELGSTARHGRSTEAAAARPKGKQPMARL